MELLKIDDLCKNINKKNILTDISVEIPYGKIIALVGKNGAGKTTLLKSIAQLYVNNLGEITFLGKKKKFIFDTPHS